MNRLKALVQCCFEQTVWFFAAVGILSFDRVMALALRPNTLSANPSSGYFVSSSVENLWLILAYGLVATIAPVKRVLRAPGRVGLLAASFLTTFSVMVFVLIFAITIAFMRP